MISTPKAPRPEALLTPDGIFVLHLRADSAPAGQDLVGRIEHMMSGDSEQFVSLDGLLAFMARHAGDAARRSSVARGDSR